MNEVASPALTLAEYSQLGCPPFPVPRPESVPEVARLLSEAAAARTATVLLGGRTALDRGNAAPDTTLGLDLTALDRVVEYEPADMTITVQAGARLADIEALVGRNAQLTGIQGGRQREATIGGAIATAAWGPHLSLMGRLRDRVIGMQVVDGTGVVRRSGGRVVKNVSGFDLTKLHVGASGSLGAITEVSLKLLPVSGVRFGLVVPGLSAAAGLDLAAGLRSQTWALRAESGAWTLLAEWWLPEAVAAARRQAAVASLPPGTAAEPIDVAALDRLWDDSYLDRAHWCCELYYPRSLAPAVLDQLGAAATAWCWPDAGVARVAFDDHPAVPGAIDGLRAWLEARSGRLIVAHRPPGASSPDAWGTPPEPAGLHRAVRDLYDPQRILNRGRYWSGL